MSRNLWNRLLGSPERDPGCEACFEVLDEFAEAQLRGADIEKLFPHVVAHITSCPACREDTEGLIATLRRGGPAEEPK